MAHPSAQVPPSLSPSPQSLRLVTFAALAGAAFWFLAIPLTIAAYDQTNAVPYSPFRHFISELGFPEASPRTWLFNLVEAVGSLAPLPLFYVLAARFRERPVRIAARLATVVFAAAGGLGCLGLVFDALRPPLLPAEFIYAHLALALIVFSGWLAAVTLFTLAFRRLARTSASRGVVAAGWLCVVAALLLFATGFESLVTQASRSASEPDRQLWTILRSQGTPRDFHAWLDHRRRAFSWNATAEWAFLVTMFIWLGAALRFLHRQPGPPASAEPSSTLPAETGAPSSTGSPSISSAPAHLAAVSPSLAGLAPPSSSVPPSSARLLVVARLVSILGHPFAFIVLLLLLPWLSRGRLGAVRVAAVVAAAGLVPLALFMRERARTGRWLTVDASAPRDRPVAYLAVFAVLIPALLYFQYVERSPGLVRGALALGAMCAVGAVCNRWIKGSGHLAFAAFTAVVLWRASPVASVLTALFLPVLGWSRLVLRRHTLPEVLAGAVLGALTGAVLLGR